MRIRVVIVLLGMCIAWLSMDIVEGMAEELIALLFDMSSSARTESFDNAVVNIQSIEIPKEGNVDREGDKIVVRDVVTLGKKPLNNEGLFQTRFLGPIEAARSGKGEERVVVEVVGGKGEWEEVQPDNAMRNDIAYANTRVRYERLTEIVRACKDATKLVRDTFNVNLKILVEKYEVQVPRWAQPYVKKGSFYERHYPGGLEMHAVSYDVRATFTLPLQPPFHAGGALIKSMKTMCTTLFTDYKSICINTGHTNFRATLFPSHLVLIFNTEYRGSAYAKGFEKRQHQSLYYPYWDEHDTGPLKFSARKKGD